MITTNKKCQNMIKNEVKLTDDFKAQTTKAIAAILLFIIVYFVLIGLAVALTALCVYAGVILIVSMPRAITILLGIGLASLGFLVLIFLVKFIFKSHKIDRSHLQEITEEEEAQLFALIQEIVTEVGTNFPKKVYLSADVNASVFYDSSFLSMFLPIKKNLQIGIGLVNCVTVEELKAILAHEFGHFSQRTMKVGSYVYNVNQVIFNMLTDNDSYDNLIQGWANVSGYFSIFVLIAVKIIEAIQWILGKMYEVVNLSYMGLSREMEFHADEIAASVTGYQPLKTSLLRLDLANQSYHAVLNYYGNKIKDNFKSENLYKEHRYVLGFLAKERQLPFANALPQVTVEELNKYNKSKLVIKDQWASHPSTEDRVSRLEKLNSPSENPDGAPANTIFKNIEATQHQLTNQLFSGVTYTGPTVVQALPQFSISFQGEYQKNIFNPIYKGYYDSKNPSPIDLDQSSTLQAIPDLDDLFGDEKIDLVYTFVALQNDIATLEKIANKSYPIKSYDYNGKKYQQKNTHQLLVQLKKELEERTQQIKKNDSQIFHFFKEQEKAKGESGLLVNHYKALFDFDQIYEERWSLYNQLLEATEFIQYTTPFDQIQSNFVKVKSLEEKLKEVVQELTKEDWYEGEVNAALKEDLEKYLSRDWEYFANEKYNDKNLELLFTAINHFQYLNSRGFFMLKKKLLNYQAELL